jgi:hypothetical protein
LSAQSVQRWKIWPINEVVMRALDMQSKAMRDDVRRATPEASR